MELYAKVIQILPLQGGTSATGKSWQVLTFIAETIENYPRKVAIEIFGEERIKENPIIAGENVTVSFDLESREFNGRWYTSARAWKIKNGDTRTTSAPAAQPTAQPAPVIPAAAPTPPTPTAQPAPLFDPNNNAMPTQSDLPF